MYIYVYVWYTVNMLNLLYQMLLYVHFIISFYILDISLTASQKFIEECNVTSKLDHPNVLGLVGVSMNPEDGTLHMIMPFMHNGDVKSFLKSKRGDTIKSDHFPKVDMCVPNKYTACYAKL